MQSLTRYNASDPVVFSKMNATLTEIEARDNEQQEQINVLSGKTFSFVGAVNETTDWDNITSNGIYDVGNATGHNSPISEFSLYPYGQLIVTKGNYTITQEYVTHAGCVTVKRSGWLQSDTTYSWTSWEQLVTTNMLQSALDALNA